MNDPAVEAVRRAEAANGGWPWDSTSGAMRDAAREALRLIREWYENTDASRKYEPPSQVRCSCKHTGLDHVRGRCIATKLDKTRCECLTFDPQHRSRWVSGWTPQDGE